MRAKDIMTTPVHVVWQNAPIESAAELMTGKAVTALPVVDAQGALVGIVSEGDLLWHRVPGDPSAHLRRDVDMAPQRRPGTVAEVMAKDPYTATPDLDVADIAEVMLRHDIRSLPVVEGREVIGIISRRDILRAMVRSDDVLAQDVQHRLDEYADGAHVWTATVHEGVATVTGQFLNDTQRAVVTVLARTVPGVSAVTVEETTAS
ncbi:CBS domain-containing protein [Amorphoplanes nipponensis]|uniref:CBS domain-containing protein n=1 Tax=Actinoplanes nipponensis TaxID=135950 RepID=A0A919JP22_9ACTN|nr:CBS domain-containing protein [Actinoplanes nipponensis]GIE54161.1 CBS domain-containing protein [Actinoplanes nipponensis]